MILQVGTGFGSFFAPHYWNRQSFILDTPPSMVSFPQQQIAKRNSQNSDNDNAELWWLQGSWKYSPNQDHHRLAWWWHTLLLNNSKNMFTRCDKATYSSHWFHPYLHRNHYIIIHHRRFPILLYWNLPWSDKHRFWNVYTSCIYFMQSTTCTNPKTKTMICSLTASSAVSATCLPLNIYHCTFLPLQRQVPTFLKLPKARSKEVALWCLKFWAVAEVMAVGCSRR